MTIRAPATLAIAAIFGFSAPASAAGDSDRARAEALFQEGVKLVDAGKAPEACAKFAESQRLDAGIGTEFRLYDCYERVGRTASAWAGFDALAARVTKPEQIRKAKARAEALEPRLSRLRIQVPAALAARADVVVERDGAPVDRSQWDAAAAVDPGPHRVRVLAAGALVLDSSVEVSKPGATVTVDVPPPAAPGMPGRRIAALVIGGAGVAGVVAGAALGGLAAKSWSDAKAACPTRVDCSQAAHDLSVRARSLSFGSTAGIAAGATALAGGVVLWLWSQAAPPRSAVWIAPVLAGAPGAALGGSF
jgi:hypothetical protein